MHVFFDRDFLKFYFTDGPEFKIEYKDTDDISYDTRFPYPAIRVIDARRNRWFYEVFCEELGRKIEEIWRTKTSPEVDSSPDLELAESGL